MTSKIGPRKRASLIQNIFNAEHDVVALAQANGLSPDELAAWVADEQNQRCLSGLCVLADLQTQLLLSRYRLLAATRLIRLATQEEEGTSADVARRACVDLLRLDLKRADPIDTAKADADHAEDDVDVMRAALYALQQADGAATDEPPSPDAQGAS